MTHTLLKKLRSRLGKAAVQSEPAPEFFGDKWFARTPPDAVVFPSTTAEVSFILREASRAGVPVTPRGAGHGYVGGCTPVKKGIVLSLDRMDKILEIHPKDFVAVVQPGVITGDLQEAARAMNLSYPPDPARLKDCSIGGNIATNAGGPRCLKYGVTRSYILGLEVVLADGTVVRCGGRTHKNKTGFDLVGLFTGSEGLLGIVTEATLRLIPLPPARKVGWTLRPSCSARPMNFLRERSVWKLRMTCAPEEDQSLSWATSAVQGLRAWSGRQNRSPKFW